MQPDLDSPFFNCFLFSSSCFSIEKHWQVEDLQSQAEDALAKLEKDPQAELKKERDSFGLFFFRAPNENYTDILSFVHEPLFSTVLKKRKVLFELKDLPRSLGDNIDYIPCIGVNIDYITH